MVDVLLDLSLVGVAVWRRFLGHDAGSVGVAAVAVDRKTESPARTAVQVNARDPRMLGTVED
ncbi:hypothetical protein LUW76_43880 [Actinomadura madurae]|uniref:hypothetical protein n=1 Tax=Actinomadura madurae TaxID=1993 RepID=UPI002025ECDC|nr:hypothetical protein [Actinomadura madurae]URN00690.1 hypothetical protein LUW76_43880 [Actinomadura madurae]